MSKVHSTSSASQRAIGVIDVGTEKVCCLIWRTGRGRARIELAGLGHQRSEGLEGGLVTDLKAAERAIRKAVRSAERMAGVTLEEVIVGVGAGRILSQRFVASTPLDDGIVGRSSLDKLTRAGQQFASRDGRTVIHLDTLGLMLDGMPISGPPLGLAGDIMKCEILAVSTDTATLAPLHAVIDYCYLTPVFVPQALASGLAVTAADEREIGVTVVDIGAGGTKIAGFADGRFIAAGAIPSGGDHLTQDLAHQLQTSLAEAERIKTLYGTLVAAPSNELERVSYPTEMDGYLQMVSVSRAEIRRILEPRVDALMGQVAEWRVRHVASSGGPGRVVFTGGGSLLVGLGSFAADRLEASLVRVGEPTAETGAPGNVRIAGYATALGLASAATLGWLPIDAGEPPAVLGSQYLGRVGEWLKRSF